MHTADHVIYGAISVYALRGDRGVVVWRTDRTKHVPRTDPCPRCEHQNRCLELGNGQIDVVGCPTAEGWRDALLAYDAGIET